MHKKWGEKKEVQKKEKKRLKMGGVKGGPKRKLWIAEIPKTTAVTNKEGGMGTMQVNWRTYPSILTLFFQCSFLFFCFFVYLFWFFFSFSSFEKALCRVGQAPPFQTFHPPPPPLPAALLPCLHVHRHFGMFIFILAVQPNQPQADAVN